MSTIYRVFDHGPSHYWPGRTRPTPANPILVHIDICELNGILTRGGNRYFITFIDDFTKFTHVYLMRNKDKAFDMFKVYKSEVENQKDKKIKVLRSDRGGV